MEDEAHFWAECPALRPARQRMLEELDCVYPGFERRFAALPRLEKGARWHVAAGGVARDVGARRAGGGALWDGDCGAVPGVGAGHVAHGALVGFLG